MRAYIGFQLKVLLPKVKGMQNKSLFHAADVETLLSRIDQLHAHSIAKWGKMDVAQMLRHCAIVLGEALKPAPTKRRLISYLFGKMAKKKFLSSDVFKPGEFTAPNMVVSGKEDFESARQDLISHIHLFVQRGIAVYDGRLHAFFGVMSAQEWGSIQYNHINHHLKQFGI
jgi:hypothetical protein